MPRDSDLIVFSKLELDRDSRQSLQAQISQFFRKAILDGELARGVRLPSTRACAKRWNVSRTTMVCVFDQLVAEGYLVARKGSATQVALELPDMTVDGTGAVEGTGSCFQITLSKQGKRLLKAYEERCRAVDEPRPFRPGVPAIGTFPTLLWRRLSSQVWTGSDPYTISDLDSRGQLQLREQVSRYINDIRGVNCQAANVFVVSSTQHAISLISQVLINPGDAIAIESPGYPRAFASFAAFGVQLLEMPVDDAGAVLRERKAKKKRTGPRAVYVTPSCQYPLGVTMPLSRRLELLDFASRNRAWIIEDDYASEFRYSGRPIAALQGLDNDDRVIYLGTFNKIFSPALRLGYVVVPDSLVDAFAAARSLIDRCPSFIDQAVLARFIQRGHFGQHVRKMRTIYKEREQHLRNLLNEHIPLLDVSKAIGGMHLIARLPDKHLDLDVCRTLWQNQISALPLSSFCVRRRRKYNGLVLGFTGWNDVLTSNTVLRMKNLLGARLHVRAGMFTQA